MVGKALAKVATKFIDTLDLAQFGSQLQKAQFDIYKWKSNTAVGDHVTSVKLFVNPETIKVVKEVEVTEDAAAQSTTSIKYSNTKPLSFEIGEMWFDTYDDRKSVRTEYIDKLEKCLDYEPETHVPNVVVFTWGDFSMKTANNTNYIFAIAKLDVTYTLFLPSGLPCRAKVAVCMRQVNTPAREAEALPKESPDHARIYTVKRGDTLQGISQFAYDTPAEWRRIATSNNIDDPTGLRPGQRLMLPPILK
jgi:hypothetical protein